MNSRVSKVAVRNITATKILYSCLFSAVCNNQDCDYDSQGSSPSRNGICFMLRVVYSCYLHTREQTVACGKDVDLQPRHDLVLVVNNIAKSSNSLTVKPLLTLSPLLLVTTDAQAPPPALTVRPRRALLVREPITILAWWLRVAQPGSRSHPGSGCMKINQRKSCSCEW